MEDEAELNWNVCTWIWGLGCWTIDICSGAVLTEVPAWTCDYWFCLRKVPRPPDNSVFHRALRHFAAYILWTCPKYECQVTSLWLRKGSATLFCELCRATSCTLSDARMFNSCRSAAQTVCRLADCGTSNCAATVASWIVPDGTRHCWSLATSHWRVILATKRT